MSKVIFVFQNLPEYDINNLYLQYSFVFTFTNIFLTIRLDWYCLFKHCLSTQRRPHARPRAMPRAVFSFTNNTVDKEYNQSYSENNQSYWKTILSYYQNNQSYWKTIHSYQSYNSIINPTLRTINPTGKQYYPTTRTINPTGKQYIPTNPTILQ